MSMSSYKAPGSDGFQPIFFKMFWQDIGDDIWEYVKKTFSQGHFDPSVTETLVILIPKGDTQTTFKDFRPISLCNVIYKLITKVLVERLRPILSWIVSPLQSGFIPGRSTVDNAIILQEVLYHMKKSKRKKGDLILKLDLEKVYDRVDWAFLQDTLRKFGFPGTIVALIMHGITSSSISILWNGCKTPGFTPCRGLRQGDPLSSYPFVLCMERLSGLINREVAQGSWKPMKISTHGPTISHLFFADDVLLFTKATTDQVRRITNLLEIFCSFSGLRINKEKSHIHTSKGVTRDMKDRLSCRSGFRYTDRITKYLGFRMFQGRSSKEDFEDVLGRVKGKLASWKGRLSSTNHDEWFWLMQFYQPYLLIICKHVGSLKMCVTL